MNRFGTQYQPPNPFLALTDVYRYGFQAQEQDRELWEGAVSFKYRVEDARLGRFFSVDPLFRKYSSLSPMQFSANLCIMGRELEGLETFIVHGTNQKDTGTDFDDKVKESLIELTGNTRSDDSFRWSAGQMNGPKTRQIAAKKLVVHILKTRTEMLQNNLISEAEPISLIGYSHGGNVSIQAAKMLYEDYGVKVNLVTISTPAKNSEFNCDSDNFFYGNDEDPQGNKGIHKHTHVIHQNDGVWKMCDLKEGSTDLIYSNSPTTTNYFVPNDYIELNGPIESHTEFPYSSNFPGVIECLPKMSSPGIPILINQICRDVIKFRESLNTESNKE